MAKRTRGSRSAPNCPGARPATTRPASTTPVSTTRPVSAPLAPAEPMPSEVQASALTTDSAAEPRAAAPSTRSTGARSRAKSNSLLAARAETEYVYVGQDLHRIARVGSALFGVLLALWIVLVVLGVSSLY